MSRGASNPDRALPQSALQTFAVTCPCGRLHEGARLPEYQVVECDACGRQLFVLPESPYPRVAPAPQSNAGKSQRRRRSARPSRRAGDDAPIGEFAIAPESRASATGLTLPTRKRWFSPLTLVIGAIAVLLAGTGYWQYRRSVRNQAEHDFREHADLGFAAMKERNFAEASKEFGLAIAALERLQRDDAKTREVRQMFRECRASNELLSVSLPEMMDDLVKRAAADPARWREQFQSRYAGQWVVLDTAVRHVHAKDGDEWVEIVYPLTAGGRWVSLMLPGNAFPSIKRDGEPQRVILAAQLEKCDQGGDDGSPWTVRLNGKTAFLWCNYENYRALGFSVGAGSEQDGLDTERQVRDRLASQSKTMGLGE